MVLARIFATSVRPQTPHPNVRRELNHLTNVITPVMGQHTVNAQMHSMRTLSRFFHPIANSNVESVTRKDNSMLNEASIKPGLTREVIGKQTRC